MTNTPRDDDPEYGELPTERRPALRDLDTLSAAELVAAIHQQDREALAAVGRAQAAIAAAVEAVEEALAAGGRLLYLGAGTSGRLAALDAAECPPTFGVASERIVATIAGGAGAFVRAVEGAEDSRGAGRQAVRELEARAPDLVCGISASGVTPFVLAALAEARRRGCPTLLISCQRTEQLAQHADLVIALDVGPETVAGSTRMKAGLATKAVLHTLSTAALIRRGHVHDNLMVDLQPTNRKLRARAARIVAALTGLTEKAAAALLRRAAWRPKVAAVMHHHRVDRRAAEALLANAADRLRPLLPPR